MLYDTSTGRASGSGIELSPNYVPKGIMTLPAGSLIAHLSLTLEDGGKA